MLADLLGRIAGRTNSSKVAKDRLQLVLLSDRKMALEPELLEALRIDLVELFSRHFDVDREGLEIQVQRDQQSQALLVSLPFKRRNPRGARGRGAREAGSDGA